MAEGIHHLSVERSGEGPRFQVSPVEIRGDTRVDIEWPREALLRLDIQEPSGAPYTHGTLIAGSGRWLENAGGATPLSFTPGVHDLWLWGDDLTFVVPVFRDTSITVHIPVFHPARGRVHPGTTAPLQEQTILLTEHSGRYSKRAPLNADGTFQTDLPGGEYAATHVTEDADQAAYQTVGSLSVPAAGDQDWTLTATQPSQLHLFDAQGNALLSHRIFAVSAAGATSARVGLGGSAPLQLVPGPYQVSITDERHRVMWHLGEEVGLGDSATESVSLPGGARLTGRVRALGQFTRSGEDVLVEVTDDPLRPTHVLTTRWDMYYDNQPFNGLDVLLSPSGSTLAAQLVQVDGLISIEIDPGRYYVVALPFWGHGIGSAKALDIRGETYTEIAHTSLAKPRQLYGQITAPDGLLRGAVVLRFYDEATGVVVQWSDDYLYFAHFAAAGKQYLVSLPPGRYRVRAGLVSLTEGFYAHRDLGEIDVRQDRRWDIDLTAAPTAVEDGANARPDRYALEQNFPNPFNPSTTIRYRLPERAEVELAIFNLVGQRVVTLVEEGREAGTYTVGWDGRDVSGEHLGTGVYLYRLRAGRQAQTRKLLLLR